MGIRILYYIIPHLPHVIFRQSDPGYLLERQWQVPYTAILNSVFKYPPRGGNNNCCGFVCKWYANYFDILYSHHYKAPSQQNQLNHLHMICMNLKLCIIWLNQIVLTGGAQIYVVLFYIKIMSRFSSHIVIVQCCSFAQHICQTFPMIFWNYRWALRLQYQVYWHSVQNNDIYLYLWYPASDKLTSKVNISFLLTLCYTH